MSSIYVAIDGDNVGSYLEYLMLTDNMDSLIYFSSTYNSAMVNLIENLTKAFGGFVIFEGGDNLLISIEQSVFSVEQLEQIRISFAELSGKTLSIGLGSNAREAYFALKLAKTSGKNCTRHYKELSNV